MVEYVNGVVVLEYEDLVQGKDLAESIEAAYSKDGLGILLVRGVPDFADARKQLLPLAQRFAQLPNDIKQKYEDKASVYNFGWSHGKEMLDGKVPDFAKGSYYNNPLFDVATEDEKLIAEYPASCRPNVWPKEDMPELESSFKRVGKILCDVGALVAKQCDKWVARQLESYESNKLEAIIKSSRASKARLLYYFPPETAKEIDMSQMDSWCGWHTDHGSITGLCSAMYVNADGETVANPDAKSGLYIRNRKGEVVRASIPGDMAAFQIGESAQIHSGGLLRATPHCVQAAQGPEAAGIGRCTFACFMQPNVTDAMDVPAGRSAKDVEIGEWREGQTFAQFMKATVEHIYN